MCMSLYDAATIIATDIQFITSGLGERKFLVTIYWVYGKIIQNFFIAISGTFHPMIQENCIFEPLANLI